MTAQKGKDLLLKVDTNGAGSFVTVVDGLPASASVADDLATLQAALIEDGIITEAKLEAAKRGRRQPTI